MTTSTLERPERIAFKVAATDVVTDGSVEVREDEGVVTAVVSVTGVIDEVDDIIEPGAYRETLAKRMPKVCWHHSWEQPIGRVLHIEELMPGDPRLPTKTRDGKAWPKEAGALIATMQFNMKSDRGREAFEAVRFYSESGECEWSIGYQVPAGKASRDAKGVRRIKAMDLYELSFVLFGAHTMTGTLSLKAAVAVMHEHKASGHTTITLDEIKSTLDRLGIEVKEGRATLPDEDDDEPADEPEGEPAGDAAAAEDPDVLFALDEDPQQAGSTGGAPEGEGAGAAEDVDPAALLADLDDDTLAAETDTPDDANLLDVDPDSDDEELPRTPARVASAKAVKALVDTTGADPWYVDLAEPSGEYKRKLTAEQRRRKPTLPGSDTAWPIGDREDLRAAIQSFGRAPEKDRDKVKRWIIKRARELGAVNMLPDDWNVKKGLPNDPDAGTVDVYEAVARTAAESLRLANERKAGGADRNRGNAEELRRYWTTGEGGARIAWGTPGDFSRCVRELREHMGERAKGYCANRHREMTGMWPGDRDNTGDEGKALPKTQTCKYCSEQADRRVVWADGRAYIPTCASHESKARDKIAENNDEVTEVRKIDGKALDTPARDPGENLPAGDNPENTGVMVAVYPDPETAEKIAVRGGHEPDDLHVTLAYLGDVTDDAGNGRELGNSMDAIMAAAQSAAATHQPLSGTVGGLGKFPQNDDGVPVWTPVDVVGLGALREAVVDALTTAGLPVKADHGFTPHMTLGYNLDMSLIPDIGEVPVEFDHIAVVVGDSKARLPLGTDTDLGPRGGAEPPQQPEDDEPKDADQGTQTKAARYDPTIEVGPQAGHKAASTAPERKGFPRLEGTYEERQQRLEQALHEALVAPRMDDDGEPGMASSLHLSIEGTYPDRVICTVHDWSGAVDNDESYEVSYRIDDEGTVHLGEPERVQLTVTAVDVDGETDDEVPVGDLLPLADMVEDVVGAFKTLPEAEVKAGRVLSASNAQRLKSAVEHLIHVLAAAGVSIDADDAQVRNPVVDDATTAPAARRGEGKSAEDVVEVDLSNHQSLIDEIDALT